MTDEPLDLQAAAGRITDAFDDHDTKSLAALTPDDRAIQTELRWRLYEYLDTIWQAPHLRERGIHPNEAGGYEPVAALRDLLGTLWHNAQDAQHEAGDDTDGVSVDVTVRRDDE